MSYDLFISYSRRDNTSGRITELKRRIESDYRAFAKEDLRCFFDLEGIHGMDDWQHRILQGLRESQLLLLVLSPGYLKSEYCEWEIVEYLKYEHSRAAAGQGVAPVYFVEVPGLDTPDFEQTAAAWVARVRRRNHFDLRPWHDEGEAALKRLDVRARLDDLEKTLHTRISKLRRLAAAPGNLPAHNPHFVGRETEMTRLHESAGLGRFGVLTAIQGMGGLGKTALAIQYACAYADFYPGGRWLVGCAGETSLAGAIRKLESDLGITFNEEEKRDDGRAARRVLAELESRARQGAEARAGETDPPQPRALLLLDNVDDAALLQPPQSDLISGKRWLHVIATTRMGGEAFGHDPDRQMLLAVDELPVEDAVRLIETHQPEGRFPNAAERNAAEEIAKVLGGFTLAIEVVAIHLRERRGRITCAAFLERLRREGLGGFEAIARGTKGGISHQEKLVSATLGPTLDLLSPEEQLVLSYAALLPPDTIPLPWLRALVAKEYPTLGKDAEPGYDDPWLDLVNHLLGLRLLQVVDIDPDSHAPRLVRMHRLVGELVISRSHLDGDIDSNIPLFRNSSHPDKLTQCLFAHAIARSKALRNDWLEPNTRWEIEPLRDLSWTLLRVHKLEGAELAVWVSLTLSGLSRCIEARELLRNAILVRELTAPTNLVELATVYGNLGYEEHLCGNDHEARRCLEMSIKLTENDPHHSELSIANKFSLLSEILATLGDLETAVDFCKRCLEVEKRMLPSIHENLATRYSNLCSYERIRGNYVEAQKHGLRAIAINEAIHKVAHPDLAFAYNSLGLVEQELGNMSRAEELLRRSLEIRIGLFGSANLSTANGMVNLARVLLSLDREHEAESYAKSALDIWRHSQVPDDWRSGKAHWLLGTVAARRGDTATAKHHLEDALRLLLKGNSEQHPWVVAVRKELEGLR